MELVDPAATFNDDYLWFYEPMRSTERNGQEAMEIVAALGLEPPAAILDAPCGHGRIANALANNAFSVLASTPHRCFSTARDRTLERSRWRWTTDSVTCGSCLSRDHSTRWCVGSRRSDTSMPRQQADARRVRSYVAT
jgi:hypothetical protein